MPATLETPTLQGGDKFAKKHGFDGTLRVGRKVCQSNEPPPTLCLKQVPGGQGQHRSDRGCPGADDEGNNRLRSKGSSRPSVCPTWQQACDPVACTHRQRLSLDQVHHVQALPTVRSPLSRVSESMSTTEDDTLLWVVCVDPLHHLKHEICVNMTVLVTYFGVQALHDHCGEVPRALIRIPLRELTNISFRSRCSCLRFV